MPTGRSCRPACRRLDEFTRAASTGDGHDSGGGEEATEEPREWWKATVLANITDAQAMLRALASCDPLQECYLGEHAELLLREAATHRHGLDVHTADGMAFWNKAIVPIQAKAMSAHNLPQVSRALVHMLRPALALLDEAAEIALNSAKYSDVAELQAYITRADRFDFTGEA
jgi:hypothetical protein